MQASGFLGLEWEWGLATNACEVSLWGDGNVIKLNCGDALPTL